MNSNEIEILLVEDNFGDAEFTIRILNKICLANKFVHLQNGADAIDYLFGTGVFEGRNVDNLPKLILLDLKMPKVSGIEVLQIIRATERTRNIPVIVLTSSKFDADIEEINILGVKNYIIKPLKFDSFARAVSELGFSWILSSVPPEE